MKTILVGKKPSFVDDEDYARICLRTWTLTQKGYAITSINRKNIFMHNLILGVRGVDHKDGNRLNNQRDNLRLANQSQNTANSKLRKTSSSGYKGVSWHKQDGLWRAHITHNYKFVHIGLFSDKRDAALAYNKKAKELFGEFARLNEVSE